MLVRRSVLLRGWLAGIAIALVLIGSAFADEQDAKHLPWGRGYMNLGYYMFGAESGFRIGSSNIGIGIDLDVEDFLGMEATNTAFRMDAGYRYGTTRRHLLDFSWFALHRQALRSIGNDIVIPPEYGGGIIHASTVISSIFNIDIYRALYRYSLLLDDRIDVHLGIGAYVMPIKIGFGELDKEQVSESITAPLPLIGIGVDLAVTPRWFLRQSLDLFTLGMDGFRGRILNTRLAVEYSAWKHVAIGLGYDNMSLSIESVKESDYPGVDFNGAIVFDYYGINTYMKFRF